MRFDDKGRLQTTEGEFQEGELLPDQTGAGAVLNFNFTNRMDVVHIFVQGTASQVARLDAFGGIPTATRGIPIVDEVLYVLPIRTKFLRIFTPTNMEVTVWGFRKI